MDIVQGGRWLLTEKRDVTLVLFQGRWRSGKDSWEKVRMRRSHGTGGERASRGQGPGCIKNTRGSGLEVQGLEKVGTLERGVGVVRDGEGGQERGPAGEGATCGKGS